MGIEFPGCITMCCAVHNCEVRVKEEKGEGGYLVSTTECIQLKCVFLKSTDMDPHACGLMAPYEVTGGSGV